MLMLPSTLSAYENNQKLDDFLGVYRGSSGTYSFHLVKQVEENAPSEWAEVLILQENTQESSRI